MNSYSCIMKHDANILVGAGSLTTQHSMSLNSILGFYPSWIRFQAVLSPDSRTVKFINENFDLSQKLDRKECSLFLPTQLHYMKEQFQKERNDIYFDLPFCENLNCKAARSSRMNNNKGKSDNYFHDLYVVGQPVFETSEIIIVHHSNMTKENINENYLIRRFPFGEREMLSIRDIAVQCNLPRNLDGLASFKIPDDIWCKIISPQRSEHNYFAEITHQMNGIPSLTKDASLFADKVISNYLLN